MGRPNPELPEIKIEENDNSTLEDLKQELHQGTPIADSEGNEIAEGSEQTNALKETRVSLEENTEEIRATAREFLIKNQSLVDHLRGTANLYADFQSVTNTFKEQLDDFNNSPKQEADIDIINAAKDAYVEAIKGLIEQAILLKYEQRQSDLKNNKEKNKQASQEEVKARGIYRKGKRRHAQLTRKIARLDSAIAKTTGARKARLEQQKTQAQTELDTIDLNTLKTTHQEKLEAHTQSIVNVAISKIQLQNEFQNLRTVRRGGKDIKQLNTATTLDTSKQEAYNTKRGQYLQDRDNRAEYITAKTAWKTELARHKKELLQFENDNSFDNFLNLEIADLDESTDTSQLELIEKVEFNTLVEQINETLTEEEKVQAQNAQIAANALLNSSTREIKMQEGAISEAPTEELTTSEGNIDFGLAVFGSITVPKNSEEFPNGLATRKIDTKGTRRNLSDDELINDSTTYNLQPGDAITIDFLREPTTLESSIQGTTHMYARIRTINGHLVRGQGLYVSTRHLEQLIHKADYQESLQTIEQDSIEEANRFVHRAETELGKVLSQNPNETATPFNNALDALTAADEQLSNQLEDLEHYKSRLEQQGRDAQQIIPKIEASQQKVREYQTQLKEFRDRIQKDYRQLRDTLHQSGQDILDLRIDEGVISDANNVLQTQDTTLSQLDSSLTVANEKIEALNARLQLVEQLIAFRKLEQTYKDSLNQGETDLANLPQALTTAIDSVQNNLSKLDNFITSLEGGGSTMQTIKSNLEQEKKTLETYLNGLTTLRTTIESDNSNQEAPKALTDEIARIEGRPTALQSAIDLANQRLTEISNQLPLARRCKAARDNGFPGLKVKNATNAQILLLAKEAQNISDSEITLNGAKLSLNSVPEAAVGTFRFTDSELFIEWNNSYTDDTAIHLVKNGDKWVAGKDHDDDLTPKIVNFN
jgi:myosin heavy subunit